MSTILPPPRRGRGLRPTPAHKAGRFGALHPLAAAAPYPPAGALRRFWPRPFDQGESETCYAHAGSSLTVVNLAAAGTPLSWVPGPLGIARNTLAEEQPTGPLQDTGADLVDLMTAMDREGIGPLGPLAPDGRYSDVTPELLTRRATLLEDEATCRTLVLGPQRLDVAAPDFLDQVATSIGTMQCGVLFGIHASPPFEQWRAGMPALADASGFTDRDGHAVAALDYRTSPATGELEIWLLSSWGDFGDAGGAWVTASWLLKGGALEAWRFKATLQAAA